MGRRITLHGHRFNPSPASSNPRMGGCERGFPHSYSRQPGCRHSSHGCANRPSTARLRCFLSPAGNMALPSLPPHAGPSPCTPGLSFRSRHAIDCWTLESVAGSDCGHAVAGKLFRSSHSQPSRAPTQGPVHSAKSCREASLHDRTQLAVGYLSEIGMSCCS